MQMKNYTIRTMTGSEIDITIDWAAQEGWNPGLYDAECYYTADPNGFLIGCLGEEPIATISAIRYGESFGFLGFYIVKPEFRGKGYGFQIWKTGMEYLKGRNIGLDGVVDQQENYKKSGFTLAHRNVRYEGTGGNASYQNKNIVDLSSIPFEIIETYELPFFPENRSAFLKCWLNQPDSTALGMTENEKLAGYGLIRKCKNGYKIGPLYADNPDIADNLFLSLKSKIDATNPIYLDTPEVNKQAIDLAERHNMKASFETARMYTKEDPGLPLDQIFGITSFEIG